MDEIGQLFIVYRDKQHDRHGRLQGWLARQRFKHSQLSRNESLLAFFTAGAFASGLTAAHELKRTLSAIKAPWATLPSGSREACYVRGERSPSVG